MRFATRFLFLALLLAAAAGVRAQGSTVAVNSTADEYDAAPNAVCSLREAVQTANDDSSFGGCVVAGTGTPYTVVLTAGTYTLTRAGAGEDANATGDLDVRAHLIVTGSPTLTTIDGGALDRIFDAHPTAALTLFGLRLTGGNADTDGGAVRVITAALTIDEGEVFDNQAAASGGGLFLDEGVTVFIESTSFHDNTADFDETTTATRGGAIYVADPSSAAPGKNEVFIDRSAFYSNDGDAFGGAIAILGQGSSTNPNLSEVTIRNSTISGNTSDSSGGGISNGGFLTLDGVTITGNTSNLQTTFSGGGGLRALNGLTTMRNTIIAGNVSTGAACDDISGTDVASAGANLIGTNDCIAGVFPAGAPNGGGNYVGTQAAPLDPQLGPLADNGGLTPTHALIAGSPAIDHGNTALPTDQRGATRDATPDIGAFEFGATVAGEPGPTETEAALVVAPNPVRTNARLALTLPSDGPVRVAVYDVAGRDVAMIHDGPLAAGAHTLAFEAGRLAAGVYVVRVAGNGFTLTQRVAVVR